MSIVEFGNVSEISASLELLLVINLSMESVMYLHCHLQSTHTPCEWIDNYNLLFSNVLKHPLGRCTYALVKNFDLNDFGLISKKFLPPSETNYYFT